MEEVSLGALTRRTEFPQLPARGIRNQGWTTKRTRGEPHAPALSRVGSLTYKVYFHNIVYIPEMKLKQVDCGKENLHSNLRESLPTN